MIINKYINKYIETFYYTSEITSNLIGTIILTIGLVKGILILKPYFSSLTDETSVIFARLEMAEAILLGLTFMLIADVIKTIRVPSLYQLFRVSILIGIRQFLTYYLGKEHNELQSIKNTMTVMKKGEKSKRF